MGTIAMAAAGTLRRPPLTPGEVARWLLRNLAILMGAFYPAMLLLGIQRICAGELRDEGCGALTLLGVPFLWLWLAPVVLLLGVPHVCLVLAVAWRWPRVARVLAALTPVALFLAFGDVGQLRRSIYDLPLAVLCILYYAFMLRLDPREPLDEAGWVWKVPVGIAAFNVTLEIAWLPWR